MESRFSVDTTIDADIQYEASKSLMPRYVQLLTWVCFGLSVVLLLVSAAALWALSGLFLLPLPLAMALAWVWQRLCDRGAAVSAAVPAAVLALCAVSSILFMF